MKLYMVKTDRDRSLMTESKKQALKDFEREIDYIGVHGTVLLQSFK